MSAADNDEICHEWPVTTASGELIPGYQFTQCTFPDRTTIEFQSYDLVDRGKLQRVAALEFVNPKQLAVIYSVTPADACTYEANTSKLKAVNGPKRVKIDYAYNTFFVLNDFRRPVVGIFYRGGDLSFALDFKSKKLLRHEERPFHCILQNGD